MVLKQLIKHRYFKITFLILLILSIIIISIILIPSSNPKIQKIKEILTNSDKCTAENTTFTVSPIDIENIVSIIPLGNLNPSGHTFPTDHMYYNIKTTDGNAQSPTVDVELYAPIDATIETINVMTYKNAEPPSTDYSINFRTCENFTFYFIHTTSLSDKLLNEINLQDDDCDEYTTGGRIYQNCWQEVNIDVKAGEVIGTVGSGIRTNFDFGVTDNRIPPHTYANSERWEDSNREDMFYTVCSTNYYTDELKAVLEIKIGDWNGNKRTIDPICGTIAQDIPETAQGIWVLKGTKEVSNEDPHIALVHDNIDPTIGVFSIGNSLENIGITSGTYRFNPKETGSINLDFDLIQPADDIYCYQVAESFQGQDNNFSILISLTSENTLLIGPYNSLECGSGSWSLNEYVEFER